MSFRGVSGREMRLVWLLTRLCQGFARGSAKSLPGVYREVQVANHHPECLACAHDSHVQ